MKKIILSLLSIALITPTASAKNFNGFYTGLYTGYSQAKSDIIEYDSAGVLDGYTGDISPSGSLYGAVVGYDWALDNKLIAGFALDYEGRNSSNNIEFQKSHGVVAPDYSFGSEITSTYSLRARLGYMVNDDALIYLTAGIAKANVELSVIKNTHSQFTDFHKDLYTGYTLGFGGNYALGKNFQLFGEYRYSDYGSKNIDMTLTGGGSFQFDQEVTDHSIRIGAIYRFF